MNEKTFNDLSPEVQLSVCPHEIQNFRNSIADISILGQFLTYLEFRGEKYLNTANDFPNLLSYGATFRMGVFLPNYPEKNIVKGENVPNFKMNTGTSDGTSSVFQILQDLRQKQYQYNSNTVHNTVHTMNIAQMAQPETSFGTTTPSTPATTTKQVNPVQVHKNISQSGPPAHCAHVYKSTILVCKPGESLALRKSSTHTMEQTLINKARHSVTLFQLL